MYIYVYNILPLLSPCLWPKTPMASQCQDFPSEASTAVTAVTGRWLSKFSYGFFVWV